MNLPPLPNPGLSWLCSTPSSQVTCLTARVKPCFSSYSLLHVFLSWRKCSKHINSFESCSNHSSKSLFTTSRVTFKYFSLIGTESLIICLIPFPVWSPDTLQDTHPTFNNPLLPECALCFFHSPSGIFLPWKWIWCHPWPITPLDVLFCSLQHAKETSTLALNFNGFFSQVPSPYLDWESLQCKDHHHFTTQIGFQNRDNPAKA